MRASHLIPLKAKAWIELSAIDDKNARKHKNDIIRLYQLLLINEQIQLPLSIKNDMRKFIDHIEKDPNIDLKNLGLKNTRIETILSDLKTIYKIASLPSLGEILTQKRGDELFQITREAISAGVDVNDNSLNGDRPLQLLIKASLDPQKKLELVKEFTNLGADIHSADKSGLTPYQIAIAEGNKDVSDFLRYEKKVRPMSPPETGYAQHYNMYREIPLP